MTPLYFGSAQRRLFGVYTPARSGTRAAVLCYPWGQEYIRAHRSMKQLANMVCGAGYHVLRFDYFGSGDSAGEAHEAANLRSWESDIDTAIEELQDSTGATRVSLIGLRLGATVAARVAARRKKGIESLVLWDPIVSGPEYLDELLSLAGPGHGNGGSTDPEVLGFKLTPLLVEDIRAIGLAAQVATLPQRTRIITSKPLVSHVDLRAELERGGRTDVVIESIDSLLAWRQYRELGAGAVPTKILDAIVQWLK